MSEESDTHRRALAVNLDLSIYGTFAEIGAGQEVARWFFQVGGAAGTVAKTISAYDMTFSDAIYGKSGRYVSRERLQAMLDHEYALLHERLSGDRAAKTRFFVFADSVSARNFAGTNECHGWLGLRFQTEPNSPPSEILLHVNMMEPSNLLQQRALGILGVNLIYSAFFERQNIEHLLKSIFDGLSLQQIEIDVFEVSGPGFESVDAASMALCLVQGDFTNSVLIHNQRLTQPSDLLRKRPVVLQRGLFRTPESIRNDQMQAAAAQLVTECPSLEREPLPLFELTTRPVMGEPPTCEELRERIDHLISTGMPAALTRLTESYHLTEYIRRYTPEPIRFTVGASSVVDICLTNYGELRGGRLEALARLLAHNVRVYVFPMSLSVFQKRLHAAGFDGAQFADPRQDPVTVHSIRLPLPVGHLYAYLKESGAIVSVDVARPD